MKLTTPCPSCRSTLAEKYPESTWCRPCVERELREQELLDSPVQEPEIINNVAES